MRTRIKICGLTREADVDAAVEAGVDAVGFVFYGPSPRNVSIQQAQRMVRRLPAWMSAVGLFVNASRHQMIEVADQVGLSHLQLHGDEPPERCTELGRPVIKAIRVTPGVAADRAQSRHEADRVLNAMMAYMDCQAVLFDADSVGFGGSGKTFDWSLIEDVLTRSPRLRSTWVLSGGLESQSVVQAIARLRPPCVDVSSGVELLQNGVTVKGLKDAKRIMEFVAAVRTADALQV